MLQSTERQLVAMILLMAAALGVAYALVTPAWMNAEEPRHFENVRLLVERGSLAEQPGLAIRQRIAASVVVVHHSWGVLGRTSNARIATELGVRGDADWGQLRDDLMLRPGSLAPGPYTLGTTQLGEPPGYYVLLAPLQLLVPHGAVETQLLVARLGSVLIGLLTVWFGYSLARELFPGQRLMRVGAPALVALLPAFVNVVSAVQNTVAAAAAFTLLLYAAVRLIRQGFSARRLVLLLAGAAACALSKPTAWVGVPLALVALPLARRRPWPAWALWGMCLGVTGAGLAAMRWQWPAGWYPVSTAAAITAEAPHGRRALLLNGGQPDGVLWQVLPDSAVEQLRGRTVTVGAWMRSDDGPSLSPLPGLWASPRDGEAGVLPSGLEAIEVGQTWEFHAATLTVPPDTQCMSVRLLADAIEPKGAAVEYDGLLLAVGEWPLGEPPSFVDRYAARGVWGGQPFDNLVANGSAERGRLLLRPEAERALGEQFADTTPSINRRLASFQDWRANWPYLSQTARWVFTGFWARFGWTAPGLPKGAIAGLAVVSALAGGGLLLAAIRAYPTAPAWRRRAMGLCFVAGLSVFALAIARLDPFTLGRCDRYFGRWLSSGYYVQPAVVPVLAFWLLGLLAWLPERWHRWLLAGCVLGFFVLNIGALLGRQIPFYLAAYGLESQPTVWSIPQAWLQ